MAEEDVEVPMFRPIWSIEMNRPMMGTLRALPILQGAAVAIVQGRFCTGTCPFSITYGWKGKVISLRHEGWEHLQITHLAAGGLFSWA